MAITTSNSIKVNPVGPVPNRAPAPCIHLRNDNSMPILGSAPLTGTADLLGLDINGGFIIWLEGHRIRSRLWSFENSSDPMIGGFG